MEWNKARQGTQPKNNPSKNPPKGEVIMSELEKKLKVQLSNVKYILKLEEENTDYKEMNKILWDNKKKIERENTELKKQLTEIITKK